MAKNNQATLDLLAQAHRGHSKSRIEKDLHHKGGGVKVPKRDLKALVKTLWAVIDKIDNLEGAITAISDKLDEMLNRQ